MNGDRWLKQLLSIFVLVLISTSLMADSTFEEMKVERSSSLEQAPAFSLTSLEQQPIALSDYKGKVVVLNFWATYCIPCRIEMPSLQQLSQQYKDKDVSVVTISLDKDKTAAIRKLADKLELTFPIALDGQSTGDDYQVSVLPVTYIINKKGQMLGRAVGDRDWTSEEAYQLIDSLLVEH